MGVINPVIFKLQYISVEALQLTSDMIISSHYSPLSDKQCATSHTWECLKKSVLIFLYLILMFLLLYLVYWLFLFINRCLLLLFHPIDLVIDCCGSISDPHPVKQEVQRSRAVVFSLCWHGEMGNVWLEHKQRSNILDGLKSKGDNGAAPLKVADLLWGRPM